MKAILAITTALASASAFAGDWYCHTDKVTESKMCFSNVGVRPDGIRTADMATGGPKGVEPNGHSFAINCSTGYVHIKDRQGVSYGGGDRSSTPALNALTGSICEANVKASRKK